MTAAHHRFAALVPKLLLPCLDALQRAANNQPSKYDSILDCLEPVVDNAGEELMARGRAWCLLGTMRLHLVAPPHGLDPAAKHRVKRDHCLRIIHQELQPELEVRPK